MSDMLELVGPSKIQMVIEMQELTFMRRKRASAFGITRQAEAYRTQALRLVLV